MRNAKFWVYWNGDWVKLKLKPDQGVTARSFQWTDEGFSETIEEYYYNSERNVIESTTHNRARDCDGPIDYHSRYYCNVNELMYHEEGEDEFGWNPPRPKWEKTKSWQRDYYAEAMGY